MRDQMLPLRRDISHYGLPSWGIMNQIVAWDADRVRQKRLLTPIRKEMHRLAREALRAPEITWISEGIASLPIEKWVVEQPDDGTWFFKVVLTNGTRANIQVDRDDKAFVSVHKGGESIGMAHGALREVITAVQRIA